MPAPHKVNDWKVWALICGLGALGVAAVMPYVLDLQGPALRQAAEKSGMSVPVMLALSAAQGVVLLGICSRVGIWAARHAGFSFPLIDAIVARTPVPWPVTAALWSVLLGLAAGALVVVIDVFVFAPSAAIALSGGQPAAWKGFLASFYGGITEEIFLRLFLLSLLALGLRRVMLGRTRAASPCRR